MRILILGGDGMLGHQLFRYFSREHDVRVTLRQDIANYHHVCPMFNERNAYTDIDVRSFERLIEVISDFRPDFVLNAVGIVKQRSTSKESIPSIEINALLPHRLAVLCSAIGARLVHYSTDCVFSGRKGSYLETDLSDAEDLYGKSKFLGEVNERNCITLRSSIIGRELSRKTSLFEWFLSQSGTVKGFSKAIYTGFTTKEMSRITERMLLYYPDAHGVYQISSEPINKYELLLLFRDKLNKKIEIVSDDSFVCDRSLDSTRFRHEFQYTPPTWSTMIEELASEVI
jgi:dTDP-4-dehydrorhamnose reductase